MKVYLSGSMSNCMDTYKDKFNAAEKLLTNEGHIVINPAMLPVGLDYERYMPICLAMIDGADIICMIGDDWENSKGAIVEKVYAEYQNKQVWYLNDMENKE